MENLLFAVVVFVIMGFFLYKNIQKVTNKLDSRPKVSSHVSYNEYAKKIELLIQNIVGTISQNTTNTYYDIKLKDKDSKDDFLNKLNKNIETLKVVQDPILKNAPKEIEQRLFKVLSSLEEEIILRCEDGEKIAQDIKERLFREYQNMQNNSTAMEKV